MIEPQQASLMEDVSNWRHIGRFDFNGHGDFWVKFLPEEPGLYKLKFDETTYYVGQGKSIHRRLGDYYQPGQGIEVDHRINRALKRFGGAEVEVITGAIFASSRARTKREGIEIDNLRMQGKRVLNGRPDCIENMKDRIEYYQDEITKLQEKIASVTGKASANK